MRYYYIFLTTMLLMNVNCFITNSNTRSKKVNNAQTKGIVSDYLSYVATAPPFVSISKVSNVVPNTPPKTSDDYLSYIETAPPFKSTSVERETTPTPVKTNTDYLSQISSNPTPT